LPASAAAEHLLRTRFGEDGGADAHAEEGPHPNQSHAGPSTHPLLSLRFASLRFASLRFASLRFARSPARPHTGSKLVRLFFVSFHIVGVLIINNLVISFIVDSFSTEYEAEISSRNGVGAGGVGGDSKVHQFDAAALGSGSVSGKWTATVQRGKDGGKRRESLLQSMFRQRKGSAE
jgi:hypothetical protein